MDFSYNSFEERWLTNDILCQFGFFQKLIYINPPIFEARHPSRARSTAE